MKTLSFKCGGDHGAWECIVDVQLAEDQVYRLKAFAEKNEFLDWSDSVRDIYSLVLKGLDEQCDDELDMGTVLIWLPFGLKGK